MRGCGWLTNSHRVCTLDSPPNPPLFETKGRLQAASSNAVRYWPFFVFINLLRALSGDIYL